MSKSSTKPLSNVYRSARLRASETNDRLRSREGAAEETGIDRTRIARIELGTLNPYPEEVLLMADTYNAPELRSYYCHNTCPLGTDVCEAGTDSLDRISLSAVSSMRRIETARELLLDITEDGVIEETEKEDLDKVIRTLEEITRITTKLKCWRARHFGKEG